MTEQTDNHWTQFWQQGHATTFGAALSGNYEGVILNFWHDQYKTLPEKARLLDVATGNGALALLAANYAREEKRDWVLDACDLAEINDQASAGSNINFLSHVACEDLPYPEKSFDLVSSQFGFEYSDTSRSLAEILRVLTPGGLFAAVCHHRDSYTLNNSRKELDIYHQALEKNNIFAAARSYYEASAAESPDAPDKLKAVNYAVNRLRQAHAGHPCCDQMVGALSNVIRQASKVPAGQVISQLNALELDFRGAAQRLQDLSAAALSSAGMSELADQCLALGFSSSTFGEILHAPGEIAGYTLLVRR